MPLYVFFMMGGLITCTFCSSLAHTDTHKYTTDPSKSGWIESLWPATGPPIQPQSQRLCKFTHPRSRLLVSHTRTLRSFRGNVQTPVRACFSDFRRKMKERVTTRAAMCVPFTCSNNKAEGFHDVCVHDWLFFFCYVLLMLNSFDLRAKMTFSLHIVLWEEHNEPSRRVILPTLTSSYVSS